MKAIKITTENRPMLASRYDVEEWEYDERLPLGFYLVVESFVEEPVSFDVINEDTFNRLFVSVESLLNGFTAIERKL